MIKIITLIMLVTVCVYANFDPSWERPIKRGTNLRVTAANGCLENINKIDITLNKRDRAQLPTSIALDIIVEEDMLDMLDILLERHLIETTTIIEDNLVDNCGSITYFSRNIPNEDFEVILTDHSVRRCDDYKDKIWKVKIINDCGFIEMEGHMEPVISIMSF